MKTQNHFFKGGGYPVPFDFKPFFVETSPRTAPINNKYIPKSVIFNRFKRQIGLKNSPIFFPALLLSPVQTRLLNQRNLVIIP